MQHKWQTDRRTDCRIIHVPPHFSEFWGIFKNVGEGILTQVTDGQRVATYRGHPALHGGFFKTVLQLAEVSSRRSCMPLCEQWILSFVDAFSEAVDGVSRCGVCLQWGECKLRLKSDLKVSFSRTAPSLPCLSPRFWGGGLSHTCTVWSRQKRQVSPQSKNVYHYNYFQGLLLFFLLKRSLKDKHRSIN